MNAMAGHIQNEVLLKPEITITVKDEVCIASIFLCLMLKS
jgi:hypothetical protein